MTLNSSAADLDRLLSPLGFQRKRLTWNRAAGQFVEVVDLQPNKSGDAVTVNAGVVDPATYQVIWGESIAFFEEPHCAVRARIGALLDGRDRWWPIADASTTSEIAATLQAHVLPFLNGLRTRVALVDNLKKALVVDRPYPLPALTLAVLMSMLGNQSEACALLARLGAGAPGAWRERVSAVSVRVGCKPADGPEDVAPANNPQ